MSSSAHWEIIPPSPKERYLSGGMKRALARRYFEHDGSLSGRCVLNSGDIPYLTGLRDASNPDSDLYKDASTLIEEIVNRDEIRFVIS